MDSLKLVAELPADPPVHAHDIAIVRADGWRETIAVVMSEGLAPAEVNRRALLLSAAPELLAVLETFVKSKQRIHDGGDKCCTTCGLVVEARAAIAKARGEASGGD